MNTDVEVDYVDPRYAVPQPTPAAQPATLLQPQAVISPDAHVGADFDRIATGTQDAAPSPADPAALIRHGLVGDGTELA